MGAEWGQRWVGRVLDGRYRIERVIGSGGMGAVVAATQLALERPVAIKILAPEVRRDVDAVARMQREARLAASAGGEGVVDIIDFAIDETLGPYIVMELLHGESLEARIARVGPLSIAEAVHIATSALDTLALIHERGILHRDLKPANLVIASSPAGERVKLLDFGISRLREPTSDGVTPTLAGSAVGTPFYMSPEQRAGAPDLDARVDVYGMGGVLYACLTGRAPHEVTTAGAFPLTMSVVPRIESRTDVPPDLAAAVSRALAPAREDRFADARSMAAALRTALMRPTRPGPAVQPSTHAAAHLRATHGAPSSSFARSAHAAPPTPRAHVSNPAPATSIAGSPTARGGSRLVWIAVLAGVLLVGVGAGAAVAGGGVLWITSGRLPLLLASGAPPAPAPIASSDRATATPADPRAAPPPAAPRVVPAEPHPYAAVLERARAAQRRGDLASAESEYRVITDRVPASAPHSVDTPFAAEATLGRADIAFARLPPVPPPSPATEVSRRMQRDVNEGILVEQIYLRVYAFDDGELRQCAALGRARIFLRFVALASGSAPPTSAIERGHRTGLEGAVRGYRDRARELLGEARRIPVPPSARCASAVAQASAALGT